MAINQLYRFIITFILINQFLNDVVGTIVNEQNKGVGAYVKIDKGPYVESSPSNGTYFTYAIPKKISLINVIPKDVSYFEENSWVTIPDGVKVLDKMITLQNTAKKD